MTSLHLNLLIKIQGIKNSDEGQDLTEYALLVALIALVCVAGVSNLGAVVNGLFGGSSGPIPTPGN